MSLHTKRCCVCTPPQHVCRGCECARNGKACTSCNKKDKCENRQDRSSDNTHSDIENNIVEGVKDNENVEPGEMEKGDELLESKSQKDKIQILSISDVKGDGNCLFCTLSLAIFKTEEKHAEIRKQIVERLKNQKNKFKPYIVAEQYDKYLEVMSKDGEWGTQVEIFAASDLFDRDIYVYAKYDTGHEWLRYVIQQCDGQHKRDYIALQCDGNHFNLLHVNNRPCFCKRDSNERKREEGNEASQCNAMQNKYQMCYGVALDEAKDKVEAMYNEAMFWKQNLFEPPKCHATKELIKLMVDLINDYVANAPHSSLAMTKLMIIPQLLLQKQHKHSTRTENIKCLEWRILLWKEGKLDQLRREAATLNDRFARKYRTKKENGNESAKFAKLMEKGKVGPSLRLLQENNSRGILPLTHTTKAALQEKHPSAKVAATDTKIEGLHLDGHEGIFEEINGLMIWKLALKTQGAAGPFGINADCVRTLLSKRIFGEVAVDLRKALANLSKKMATEKCEDIEALIARRLIPLDKNPGVRPIAIGEVFT